MMEPKKNDMSGVLQTSVSVMNSEKGQQAFPRKPVGLTITVARIDLVLAGVRAQIEHLRRHRINLGLVGNNWPAWRQSGEANERCHRLSIMAVAACLLDCGLGRVLRHRPLPKHDG